jgi:predicted nucleic acid-binding protein
VTWLIDTNVISEVRKGDRCHPGVAEWYRRVEAKELYLSVLVLGEIRKGVEAARKRDPAKAASLARWLEGLPARFPDRILPVDQEVAQTWGTMAAIRPLPAIDGLLAATAKVHRLTLVTRNKAHVTGLGAEVLDPFEGQPRDR